MGYVIRQEMAQERGCEAHGLSGGLKYGMGIFPGDFALGTVLFLGKPGRNFPAVFFWLKWMLTCLKPAWGEFFRLFSPIGRYEGL